MNGHETRIEDSPHGGVWAVCSCGWTGLSWSIPGRNRVRASQSMAYIDIEVHEREVKRAQEEKTR